VQLKYKRLFEDTSAANTHYNNYKPFGKKFARWKNISITAENSSGAIIATQLFKFSKISITQRVYIQAKITILTITLEN
jgi:hypothetical protein